MLHGHGGTYKDWLHLVLILLIESRWSIVEWFDGTDNRWSKQNDELKWIEAENICQQAGRNQHILWLSSILTLPSSWTWIILKGHSLSGQHMVLHPTKLNTKKVIFEGLSWGLVIYNNLLPFPYTQHNITSLLSSNSPFFLNFLSRSILSLT